MMRSISLFLCVFLVCLTGCKKAHKQKHSVSEHKPFVVIVPSYNNEKWVEKNLRSICDQEYDNYRIVFIDDASTDATWDRAHALIASYSHPIAIEWIRNPVNQGAAENLFRAIHAASPEEIVVLVDGDDFLAHDQVLSRLNTFYADPDVWLTYGSYVEYPGYGHSVANFAKAIPKAVLKKGTIRQYSRAHWCLSHLRTFYAGLFQKIRLSDVLFEGRYMDAAYDVAFMVPMVEMAGAHARFVKDVLYLYNRNNPLNDHKVRPKRQRQMMQAVLKRPTYPRLAHSPHTSTSDQTVDLVLFSEDDPFRLYACLESIQQWCRGIDSITVLYHAATPGAQEAYQIVQECFSFAVFQTPGSDNEGFKTALINAINQHSSEYVLLATSDALVTGPIDFIADEHVLEKTGAHSLFYRLGQGVGPQVPSLIRLNKGYRAWDTSRAQDEWGSAVSVQMALYRKAQILPEITSFHFDSVSALQTGWLSRLSRHQLALCQCQAKAISLSSGSERGLELFTQGKKMDLSPLYQTVHSTADIHYEPQWINR